MNDSPTGWQQLNVLVPGAAAERHGEALFAAGALAVTLSDAGDNPVLEPPPGETPLWERVCLTGADHVALIVDGPRGPGSGVPTLIRVHSECLTGEVFGSLKCECGPQLDAALDQISREGGVVIYMRGHEGRGIGLINKLRAYALQEKGLDTLEANLALGFPPDGRDYRAASAIFEDLGVHEVVAITNNPDKIAQLEANGIRVAEREPLVVGVGEFNEAYLQTKRDRMGHRFPEGLDELLHGDHGDHDNRGPDRARTEPEVSR